MELPNFGTNRGSTDDVSQTNGMRANRADHALRKYESDCDGAEYWAYQAHGAGFG